MTKAQKQKAGSNKIDPTEKTFDSLKKNRSIVYFLHQTIYPKNRNRETIKKAGSNKIDPTEKPENRIFKIKKPEPEKPEPET